MNPPKILVFSTLFPSAQFPHAGVLIRERMFRVGKKLPVMVVSPVPWSPWRALRRCLKPFEQQFSPPFFEEQEGVPVYFPRFLALPDRLKKFEDIPIALCALPLLFSLRKQFTVIDAHKAYPEGVAATLLGKWLKRPVTITLHGREILLAQPPKYKNRMLAALNKAAKVFSVSDALKQKLVFLGADSDNIKVVRQGVDTATFHPLHKIVARTELNLHPSAKVLISVGGLMDRKGVHRVLEVLPALVAKYPELVYLVVGGARREGDRRKQLENQVRDLKLEASVRFLGEYPRDQLKVPLSAADLFVQATAHEGWSSAFLEAMACGLPVVTTDVGGNIEIVNSPELGKIVPLGQSDRLLMALLNALKMDWDSGVIIAHAHQYDWETPIQMLVEEFQNIAENA
jgi:glycosyltransferase involved in cell wall biosynthesis